ncbi:MAG: thioredoxin domain-containing protein [Candidatus Bathyarchaeota archaeon]|nr:thioredoxin domain-containing protein [Candidatus Bathyarchaeota archaeon]
MDTVKEIPLTRMDCPTCVLTLEKAVKEIKGVKNVRGNYMRKILKVTYDPETAKLTAIEKTIENLGYDIAYKHYPNPLERLRGLFSRNETKAIKTIADSDFTEKVLQASNPVTVLFSSETCPACQTLKPKIMKLAKQKNGQADFYEMDITQTETWKKYDVMSIPTVLLFRNGKPQTRFDAMIRIDDLEIALSN